MEEQDRSRSPSRRTSRVEQVVGRWLRRSRDLGSRSHSLSRDRVLVDGKMGESSASDQRNYPFRLTVQIQRDPDLHSHGLGLSSQTPILVQDVVPGGPADGRLVPGDQLVKINNVAIEDLTPGQAAEIIRECQDTVTMTVLRTMVGPKSSFITPEKRAKLKSNPVKVRFAEEVEVNGHSQGNALLFLPNVLKVYLENGQTKAFKFEPNTTVKDIVMTLKEKLSLSRIEHFSLALEQQYSATKMLLLHEEERIQQVVQKRESHDYRCLFRVCFVPKDPRNLLLDDPTTFDYLYLQGVNDVLQERFAVEMRCNTALRLAALHIQERLACCGQSPKTNLKTITKTWGIENFVSSTLLRNMREKDLRKAIGYHMKKSQSQQDPKQKGLSANQARISYLEELSDLKSFGGKSFSATMMLQDRESMVTLLVGARYGVSQVVNHKLNIMTTLTEFTSITRIELLPESDRVSLVKIYLQDIKPITLLLESVAAKDMSCLIAGYCRVFVDPNLNIFPWADETKKHRVSAEEGYVSRCGSDSDASTDTDMDPLETRVHRDDKPRPRMRSSSDPDGWKRKDRDRGRDKGSKEKGDKPWRKMREREEKDADTEKVKSAPSKNSKEDKDGEELGKEKAEEETAAKMDRTKDTGRIQIEITKVDSVAEEESVGFEDAGEERKEGGGGGGGGGGQVQDAEEPPSMSEASDSCRTDSRFLTSPSSDSLDALEEDDLISCSSSFIHPLHQAPSPQYSSGQLHPYNHTHPHPHLLIPPPAHSHPLLSPTSEPLGEGGGCRRSGDGADPHLLLSTPTSSDTACPMEQPCINPYSEDNFMCFAELSRCVDFLPSPPEASEEEDDEEEELRRRRMRLLELDESVRRAAEGVGGGGGGAEEDGVPKQSPHSGTPSLRTDFVFNFNQSDARCYYKLCSSVTPDSALSPPRPIPQPEEEQEREGEQAEAVDLEPIPILQPPPGFGDSSSDEEFFDARDRFASPEDPTSGALPRDFSAEMNPNLLRTLSLSDIGIFVADVEDEGQEKEDTEREPNEGGGRETLLQLRRRSRKRRSFMETNFTSRVTFPESDIVNSSANQNLVSNRIKINLQPQANNSQVLTSESDLPEQTQPPCPTVASLTHSEWEPAQLETKPIPSKSNGPGSLDDSGSCGQDRDPRANSRVTKQEMEMEPDAMESKSVTDLVKTASRSITVVRCRVEPDGKESTDRRGDGKEEGAGLEEGGDRKKQDFRVSENGPVFSHMLSEISEESDRCEETEDEETTGEEGTQGHLLNSEKLLEHVDEQIENNISATFSFDMNDNGIRVSPTLEIILAEQNPYADDFMSEQGVGDYFKPPSHSPPPPPPSSPLPQLPPVYKSQIHQVLLREQVCKKTMETSPKTLLSNSNSAELPLTKHKSSNGQEIDIEVKPVDNEDEASSIVSSVTTTSDEVIDSANSDNVFDDDEVSNPLNCSFSDNKAANNSDCPISTNTIGVDMDQTDTAGEPMSQSPPTMNIKDYSSSNITQIHSLHSDYASTINSITAKLGAATTVLSPTFTTGGPVNKEITTDTGLCTGQEIDKPMSGSLMPNVATRSKIISAQVNEVTTKNSFASLGKGNMVNDLSVEPPSPTRFLFQTCSPSIMSRLSASTLRGKIQRLPLFLSRSQENLNQAGLENVDDNPSQDISGDNTEITIKITDDDVTKTLDFELSTGEDMVDSDDSDNTITGSEADSDVVETISAEITHSTVYEVKDLVKRVVMSNENTPPPVQTEPTTISRTQPFSPGPYKDTPGPIVNPPGSIAGNVQGYTSDTKVDTPGPIKEAPESLMKVTSSNANVSGMEMNDQSPVIPTPIVVTTQTINGPGLSFHNKSEKVRMASSDRPLVGLCQPAAETSAPLKILSSGCGMCTICVDQSRAKTPAPLLKPDFGCRSVLASGCESVVGGIQMPLDACGCPMVYTNCFTGGDSFDDELTVYEFSCRTKNSGVAHTSGLGLPLMTTPPLPPFLSTSPPSFSSSTLSPSFPRSALFSSSTSELSPLLSPLADATDCFLSQTHKETISRLGQQRYPSPPAGFQTLRGDVDQLLTVLEGGGADRSVGGRGGRHLRDTCPAHFTENKRVLHLEARRLMTGCQKVVGVGQSSDEMLLSLADSFRHLVELAGVCLWFSGCDRCDRRNAEAVAGLADVARSFRDFCLAAERASGKRSCQDLSTKLLAKQCTALTASVFCLTQLFRTLTAL